MNIRHFLRGLAVTSVMCLALPMAAHSSDLRSASSESQNLRLLALLPMKPGFGPGDHDAYELRIGPIASAHGMARQSAYTVQQFLGGPGPQDASTFGVWTLATPNSMAEVVSDPRYKDQMSSRDRVHDMARMTMFLASEEAVEARPEAGHALLVGVLAMKPGFGFDDHASYERAILPITSRHGMKLVRSFRVMQTMGAGQGQVVAVSLWDLPKPEALQEIMSDPEYVAHIGYRNLIHDMPATSMYFVTPRK
jgi:hypothetical protein